MFPHNYLGIHVGTYVAHIMFRVDSVSLGQLIIIYCENFGWDIDVRLSSESFQNHFD